MLLSVVVAAFNVEKYLERCLRSLGAEQSTTDYEVIVVDDGSTDGTGNIARRWVAGGANRKVVQQENAGLGAARNAGLASATGGYVWFVDGDDYLAADGLPRVIDSLRAHRPDVLVVDVACADELGRPIEWIQTGFRADGGLTTTGAQFFRQHFGPSYAWLYIVRRALMLENALSFQPRINMQDAELLPRILAAAATVTVSDIVAYVYVKRSSSFINNPSSDVRRAYFTSVVEVRRRLRVFRQTVADPVMREGLTFKLRAIDGILLMSYTYDTLDRRGRGNRLALLRREGAFPFPVGASTTGRTPNRRERALRAAVNCWPLGFPSAYRRLRQNALVCHVRSAARHIRGRR